MSNNELSKSCIRIPKDALKSAFPSLHEQYRQELNRLDRDQTTIERDNSIDYTFTGILLSANVDDLREVYDYTCGSSGLQQHWVRPNNEIYFQPTQPVQQNVIDMKDDIPCFILPINLTDSQNIANLKIQTLEKPNNLYMRLKTQLAELSSEELQQVTAHYPIAVTPA